MIYRRFMYLISFGIMLASSLSYGLDCSAIFLKSPSVRCDNLDLKTQQAEDDKVIQLLEEKVDTSMLEDDIAFVKRHFLCSDEVKAIQNYSNFEYSAINRSLRTRNEDGLPFSIQKDICLLDKGLHKIEEFTGPTFRGVGMNSQDADKYLQVGNVVSDPAFSSTDTNEVTARQFANGEIRLVFRYMRLSGMHIKNISLNPYEDEVLIPRGKTFKVEAVSRKSDGSEYYLIDLNSTFQTISPLKNQ